MHPFQDVFEGDGKWATCWARRGWNVFLDSLADMQRAIRYVEENPVKEGEGRQGWERLREYGG